MEKDGQIMLSETCTAWQTDLKRHNRRNVLDKPGNLEDHVGGVSVLLDGAIDLITSGRLIKLSVVDRAKCISPSVGGSDYARPSQDFLGQMS